MVHYPPDHIKTSQGCINLVPAPSPSTSGDTSVRAPWTVAERASNCEIRLANNCSEPGLGPNNPTL